MAPEAQAERAAWLAKADLLTGIVGEFPELQGVMGRYYALHDGEHPSVCDAIAEHYQPRFAGDSLPQGPVSVILALADKLETLVGLFGIGQLPTGDKDPYALRRHALGVARLLIEHRWPIGLHEVLSLAHEAFAANTLKSLDMEGLQAFIQDRLAHQLEAAGHPHAHVMSVLGLAQLSDWSRVLPRLEAVSRFIVLPESEALAAANKRITNILKKTDQAIEPQCTEALLLEPAERALHDQLTHMAPQAQALLAQGDEAAYLRLLAQLRDAVDRFFNEAKIARSLSHPSIVRVHDIGRAGDTVYLSGTTGYDYATMTMPDGAAAQAEACWRTIRSVLAEAGTGLAGLVRAHRRKLPLEEFVAGTDGARDLRLVNGKIATLDGSNSTVSEVTIQNGVFVSVGRARGVRLSPCTKTIDLRGRAAVPGLVDNHNHILLLGLRPGDRGMPPPDFDTGAETE